MQSPAGQALVFCKTKRGSNRVGEYLERAGVKVAVIHGNKSQNARTRALAGFKSGRVTVLVATDIAARGLDIVQLPLVVNYDMPLVPSDYIHRIGRTGRAGLAGRAVSLVSPADRPLLQDIQRLLPDPIEHVVVDGFSTPDDSRPATRPAEKRSGSRGRFTSRPQGSRPSSARRPRGRSDARGLSRGPQTR
jgi:ATP-dependent RNA helicase RhlE